MKITRVAAIPLSIPFTYGLESASRSNVKQLDFCLVRVATGSGIVGWGEAFSYNCRSAVAAAVTDMIAPLAVGAARGAIGPAIPLTVDANCEWTVEQAIAMGRSMAVHDLLWLEEPVFPPEDARGMRAVGEACGIAIASGENLCFTSQFSTLMENQAVAYAQPSVTKVGGITEFLEVVKLARARKVAVAPHSPYFGPGALATLHLIASLVPEAGFEHFYLWAEASLYPGFFGNAALTLPDQPGLGLDPDPHVIARYRA